MFGGDGANILNIGVDRYVGMLPVMSDLLALSNPVLSV